MSDLITPHTRSIIQSSLKNAGHAIITRRGITMRFSLSQQPTLDGNRVEWHARIRGAWQSGKAGTVFDAAREIETLDAKSHRTHN